MEFEYNRFDQARMSRQKRLDNLNKLFQMLLNKFAGDVEQALEWLDEIAERYGLWGDGIDRETFEAMLREQGQIRQTTPGHFQLTEKGEQGMREQALRDVFGEMRKGGGIGGHPSRVPGSGGEPQPWTRPYEFGDDLWAIHGTETIRNAVTSSLSRGQTDISVGEDDVMVYETEKTTQCATALLVDCSHSMVLYGEDRMTPARTTAMALVELIKKQYPRDRLIVIAFGDDAVEVPLKKVPYLSWGPFHTNTQAALEMARRMLVRTRCPNRQILMITDGKPTVLDEGGRRYIDSFGMNRQIVNRTLDEAAQCRRKQIQITTFMVARDRMLINFVEQLAEVNQGRAYFSGLGKLGHQLLVDYMNNRRRTVR